ncbi:ribonuclease P protein component 2 [Candidatus Woesearchaeota archaeon]|nr:ribonuclease P protein component 2 [Candidatus Woesearchaeota archaeon]
MKKIKPLLPSLREKKRYLAFEIASKKEIKDISAISDAIWKSSLEFLGESGCAKAGIMILKDRYNKEKQRGLIRVSSKHVENLKASLALTKQVQGRKVIIKSIGVSGIIKKAEQKYLAS